MCECVPFIDRVLLRFGAGLVAGGYPLHGLGGEGGGVLFVGVGGPAALEGRVRPLRRHQRLLRLVLGPTRVSEPYQSINQ